MPNNARRTPAPNPQPSSRQVEKKPQSGRDTGELSDLTKPALPIHQQGIVRLQSTIGNQAAQRLLVQRDFVRDATGTVIAYEFRLGTELTQAFVDAARKLAADGTLDDADLTRLRNRALKERGTVSDHERLFLAGLMSAANVATLNSTASGANFQFPIGSLTRARRDHINNLGRELPAVVQKEYQELWDALLDMDATEILKQMSEVEKAAAKAIVANAGSFKKPAAALLKFAKSHGISASLVLTAMYNAASDSSRGDRIFAGTVYAIAAHAGHSMAGKLGNGSIKVDALTPSALAAVPGVTREIAGYVSVAQSTGMKGDTLYVNTDLDIYNLFHQSVVIHELQHAADDAAAPGGGTGINFVQRNQLEAKAYREQAKFILQGLDGLTGREQLKKSQQVANEMNQAVVVALVLEAKADVARHRPTVEFVFSLASPPPATGVVSRLFGMTSAALRRLLLTNINTMYGITSTDQYPTDQLRGESAMDI